MQQGVQTRKSRCEDAGKQDAGDQGRLLLGIFLLGLTLEAGHVGLALMHLLGLTGGARAVPASAHHLVVLANLGFESRFVAWHRFSISRGCLSILYIDSCL